MESIKLPNPSNIEIKKNLTDEPQENKGESIINEDEDEELDQSYNSQKKSKKSNNEDEEIHEDEEQEENDDEIIDFNNNLNTDSADISEEDDGIIDFNQNNDFDTEENPNLSISNSKRENFKNSSLPNNNPEDIQSQQQSSDAKFKNSKANNLILPESIEDRNNQRKKSDEKNKQKSLEKKSLSLNKRNQSIESKKFIN